ncbi:hypothetical protein O181_032931 [Austropuccinia psidii MF-1]|uniref:Uncharacterized protein n=1 Tax=Austropuccinia psidii MF-1 TaxID=1389203 RepID=A0A9Q3CXR9_9BASI|nr:hypothetical protein [Austropuccinia psidii MF-1]
MLKAFPNRNGFREGFWTITPSPQVLICPPPLLGHHAMVTSLLDLSEVITWPIKDGNGKRTFDLGPIVTMSCHPWDSNAKVKSNQPNPLQQDSPIPILPCEETLRQPTPGPSGTQWLEDLFHDEPPTPGLSPSSKPHEDIPTCEPEPELDPLHPTPSSPSRICPSDRSLHSYPGSLPVPLRAPPPPPLICTMTLARNLPAYN